MRRRVRFHRFVDGLIAAVILAAMAICLSVYMRTRTELSAAVVKHRAAAERVEEVRMEVERKERDIEQLRSDARVIESCAREKFGFIRSGDIVIKLVQDEKAVATTAGTQEVRIANLTPRQLHRYTNYSN